MDKYCIDLLREKLKILSEVLLTKDYKEIQRCYLEYLKLDILLRQNIPSFRKDKLTYFREAYNGNIVKIKYLEVVNLI